MKRLFVKIIRRLLIRRKTHISKEERYAIIISLKLIKEKSNELKAHTKKDKYYIKSSDKRMFVVFELQPNNEITIINHVYCYNVKLSERSANMIYKKFAEEYEKRIQQMEYEYMSNIQHSLQKVNESL